MNQFGLCRESFAWATAHSIGPSVWTAIKHSRQMALALQSYVEGSIHYQSSVLLRLACRIHSQQEGGDCEPKTAAAAGACTTHVQLLV